MTQEWRSLADWMEAEQLQIDIERTASIAERELEHLIEVGAYGEVREITERVGRLLPRNAEAAE